MSDILNSSLAIARQQFDELIALLPLERLRALELGSGAKRSRIDVLLETLSKALDTVERELGHDVDNPLTQLPPTQIAFFREVLEPNAKAIRMAYWESIGLREIFDSIEEFVPQQRSRPLRNAIEWSLERWRDMLEPEEIDQWEERGFLIDSALEMVGQPLFDPDLWQENMRLLRPMLLDKPPQHVRNHVRHRLTEIYRAFAFGLWMSSIALCRSLLEYALKECAPQFAIETSRMNSRGVSEDRSLKEICEDFAKLFPTLADAFETVRDSGNRVMHAKKRDVIAFPRVLREESLDCIRSTRTTLETVYVSASSRSRAG